MPFMAVIQALLVLSGCSAKPPDPGITHRPVLEPSRYFTPRPRAHVLGTWVFMTNLLISSNFSDHAPPPPRPGLTTCHRPRSQWRNRPCPVLEPSRYFTPRPRAHVLGTWVFMTNHLPSSNFSDHAPPPPRPGLTTCHRPRSQWRNRPSDLFLPYPALAL